MAITLKIEHIEGLRLRQQSARNVVRAKTGEVQGGDLWSFDKDPLSHRDVEVPRDLDLRTRAPLSTYSPSLNYGTRRLVIDKKGSIGSVNFRNDSLRNTLRIHMQVLEDAEQHKSAEGDGAGKANAPKEAKKLDKVWKAYRSDIFAAPQTYSGVTVGDGLRAIIDELPT